MERQVRMDLGYNLLLIGFMGTGKTTVATHLQKIYGMNVVDMDQIIEERAGMSIKEIFDRYGEHAFREKETELLKQLQEKKNLVISCGGGVVVREENIELMKQQGKVILLTATPKTVLERVRDSEARPILNGHKTEAYIEELMEKRRARYQEVADLVISTDGKSAEQIGIELMEQLEKE